MLKICECQARTIFKMFKHLRDNILIDSSFDALNLETFFAFIFTTAPV